MVQTRKHFALAVFLDALQPAVEPRDCPLFEPKIWKASRRDGQKSIATSSRGG